MPSSAGAERGRRGAVRARTVLPQAARSGGSLNAWKAAGDRRPHLRGVGVQLRVAQARCGARSGCLPVRCRRVAAKVHGAERGGAGALGARQPRRLSGGGAQRAAEQALRCAACHACKMGAAARSTPGFPCLLALPRRRRLTRSCAACKGPAWRRPGAAGSARRAHCPHAEGRTAYAARPAAPAPVPRRPGCRRG